MSGLFFCYTWLQECIAAAFPVCFTYLTLTSSEGVRLMGMDLCESLVLQLNVKRVLWYSGIG